MQILASHLYLVPMQILKKLFTFFGAKRLENQESRTFPAIPIQITSIAEAEEHFSLPGLQQYFELFKPLFCTRIDIDLVPGDEDAIAIGASKFGGQPDLPVDTTWPATDDGLSLSFIAQVNLQEVLNIHPQGTLLPSAGLLSFFYGAEAEAWGFDPADRNKFRVFYHEDISNLSRIKSPVALPGEYIYIPNSLKFRSTIALPGIEHNMVMKALKKEHLNSYNSIAIGPESHLLGYAGCIQNAMELQCQLVTNDLYCGDSRGYNDPRAKELEVGTDDWLLLLQVGDEEKADMMWGDAGRLYFWIKKQDLAAKKFENAWCILQCH